MSTEVSFWQSKTAAVLLFIILDVVYAIFVLYGGQIMPLGQRLQLFGVMVVTTLLYAFMLPENYRSESALRSLSWNGRPIFANRLAGILILIVWLIASFLLLAPYRVDISYQPYPSFWYSEASFLPPMMFAITGWSAIINAMRQRRSPMDSNISDGGVSNENQSQTNR